MLSGLHWRHEFGSGPRGNRIITQRSGGCQTEMGVSVDRGGPQSVGLFYISHRALNAILLR